MHIFIEYLGMFFGKQFKLDRRISFIRLLDFTFESAVALLRGFIFARRWIFMGSGSVIRSSKKLKVLGKSTRIGKFCEIDCLGTNGVLLGESFTLGDFSKVVVSGSFVDLGAFIKFGSNVGIGAFSYIGGAGGVEIGNDCIIGQYFSVHPQNHIFSDLDALIRLQGTEQLGIVIGNNCWIGSKVTIIDGACVGNGCVVAAGAVVKGSFPDNSIIAGVPAKVVGFR